jgi:hypothetical protein
MVTETIEGGGLDTSEESEREGGEGAVADTSEGSEGEGGDEVDEDEDVSDFESLFVNSLGRSSHERGERRKK